MTILRVFFFLVTIISAINLVGAERSVSFPSSSVLVNEGAVPDRKPGYEFRIVKVSASSERTALSCELFFRKKVKKRFSVDNNSSLFYRTADSVARSVLVAADGIPVVWNNEKSIEKTVYKAEEKLEFTLYFDPLPDDVGSFDFIESLFSSWNRVDISLSDGAASSEEQRTDTCPCDDVIKYPTFLGQDRNSFARWVNARLIYPDGPRNAGIEGMVKLKIVIDPDGNASYEIVKHSHPDFDAEAMRVVSRALKWAPASIRGKQVKCSLDFPVIFKLSSGRRK